MEVLMTTRTRLLLVAAMLAPLAAAQTPRHVYKVDFTIRDTGDASAKSGRKYSLLVNSRVKANFRIGNRVPTATSNSSGSTSYTYIDVGVNIDCVVDEIDNAIGMHADVDMSGAVNADKNPNANPTISQIKLNIDTTVLPGKPTVVASFDDPITSRKFDLEATVTKM
jgi:hypothetical protein